VKRKVPAIEPIAAICYHELMILGIDEVGRGPWAGPLVVGAVILGGAEIDGLDDSKKLTKKSEPECGRARRWRAGGSRSGHGPPASGV